MSRETTVEWGVDFRDDQPAFASVIACADRAEAVEVSRKYGRPMIRREILTTVTVGPWSRDDGSIQRPDCVVNI